MARPKLHMERVRTGRRTYQRIVTWILNKIVKTFLIVVFVALGFIITGLLQVALCLGAVVAAVFLISGLGVHELARVSPLVTLAVLAYAFVTCLLINDLVKVALMARLMGKPQPTSPAAAPRAGS